MELTKSLLFNGMTNEQSEQIVKECDGKKVLLKKNETLFRRDEQLKKIVLVLSGELIVTSIDYWGRRTILSAVTQNSLFGGGFAFSDKETLPFDVTAKEESVVLILDSKKIIDYQGKNSELFNKLLKNLINILANRNVNLIEKIKNLSQRNLRQKIATLVSSHAKNGKAVLPYNRQEMADYLCVDRASLSREIANMKKEGILTYKKNVFTLSENILPTL